MERIQSKQNGWLYVHQDFVYRINPNGDRQYFICRERYCAGRASFREGVVHLTTPHVHDPDFARLDLLRFKDALRTAARTCSGNFRDLFDRTAMRYPRGSLLYGFPAAEALMKRERRKHQPPIPRDVQSLIDLFRDPRWSRLQKDYEGNNFFREVISRPGQMLCVVFISHKLSGLMTRDQWYCQVDATFQSTPNILGFKQIFTMHAVEDNVDECTELYPTVYALMSSKSAEAYLAVLDCVRRIVPGFQPPGNLMSDFETALRTVFLTLWPDINVNGCWFHYTQAILRRASMEHLRPLLRNDQEAAFILKCIMVLPLLPAELMEDGFATVWRMTTDRRLGEVFRNIFSYVRDYWFNTVGTNVLSIGHLSSRTNNAVESFHNTINKKFNYVPHPNFWTFIQTLIVLDSAKNKDRFRIREGVAVKRRRIEAEDKAIQEAREKLERDNPRNFEYFFRKMAHRASGQLRENLLIRGNDLDENPAAVPQMREEEEVVDDPDDPPAFPDADQDVEDLGLRDIPHEINVPAVDPAYRVARVRVEVEVDILGLADLHDTEDSDEAY